MVRDILVAELLEEANYNPLTALKNHRAMMDELSRQMAQIPYPMVEARDELVKLAAIYITARLTDRRSTSPVS